MASIHFRRYDDVVFFADLNENDLSIFSSKVEVIMAL